MWIFSCASFELCKKFFAGCPPTQTPTQKFKSEFWIFSSQEIGSILVSLEMIFEALQSSQAIQIQVWLALFKSPKNPGIQPKHELDQF